MLTTAMKTFFAVMIAFLPPACNGNILLASWSDSNNANQGGGGSSPVIEQGGNGGILNQGSGGGETNDMDAGLGGSGGQGGMEPVDAGRSCFCGDILYGDKSCSDELSIQMYQNYKTCSCELPQAAGQFCENCYLNFCNNDTFGGGCDICFLSNDPDKCGNLWFNCHYDGQ